MNQTTPDITAFSDQINRLISENRRLQKKSDADDRTIHVLKDQYDTLQAGVNDMVEDHRRIERDLIAERDRAVRAFTEIDGTLMQAADLIMQAARARAGDLAPAKTPQAGLPPLSDGRIPGATEPAHEVDGVGSTPRPPARDPLLRASHALGPAALPPNQFLR